MKKKIITTLIVLILPTALTAGLNLGPIKATKKRVDKVDEKVVQSRTASTATTLPDTQAPTVPTNLTATAASSSQINLSWTASTDNVGVTSYKIYRDGGTTPIATPTGTTYNNTGLTASTAHSYTVSACDAAGNCSGQSSAASGTTPSAVGGVWVFVPGNLSIGTNDFYVMKYEAKNVGGDATSQADSIPWVNINHGPAVAACAALGTGFHLVTIAEAQTINRNIEAQAANWADGVIGSLISAGGGLKRGNIGITDSASYNAAALDFGAVRNAKAKLVLSTGEEILDWSGNAWEFIYGPSDYGAQGTPNGVTFDTGGYYEWNKTSSPDLNQERPVLGPSNASYTSLYGVGQYYGGTTNQFVRRGGAWGYSGQNSWGVNSGVFAFCADESLSGAYDPRLGFRCSKATSPDTQAPTVPTNLTATAASPSQINLSWAASADNVGVTNYRIYRDGGASPIATPTGTTYNNTGLTVSTAYSYTVSACDAAGNCSAKSPAASATTLPDTQAPTVPTNLTAVAVSSSQINLSWTASTDNVGVTSYKIYRDGGATPIATPTGTTYNNTGLTASIAYSYTVSACDAAGNCSGQSSAASDTTLSTASTVGGEWVLVPGTAALGTNDFYVMKYEAKNVGGVATSQADGTPWGNIDHPSAVTACAALGSGSHLLTIAETQTININIETQTANWADGIIGSPVSAGGGLKRGNVDITDSASYNGADPEYGTGRDVKAKLILSNGEQIWDWSGNVWEWIYGAAANGALGTPGGVTFNTDDGEWNSVSPDLSQERLVLGPLNGSYTSLYGVGIYYGGGTTNGVSRGGGWANGSFAGVFAFRADYHTSNWNTTIGFRCGRATTPPDTQAPTD